MGSVGAMPAERRERASRRSSHNPYERQGKVACPMPGCASCWPDQTVAMFCSESTFEAYMESRCRWKTARQMAEVLEKAGGNEKAPASPRGHSPDVADLILGEVLKASCQGAKQCGRCMFGPIEITGCDDLVSWAAGVAPEGGARGRGRARVERLGRRALRGRGRKARGAQAPSPGGCGRS